MIDHFLLNGCLWHIKIVNPDDIHLIDRTNTKTLATTDPITKTVYVSSYVYNHRSLLCRVLLHELGHCVMLSFDLIEDIHRMVRPECWMEAEEWTCNYIADYGIKIFNVLYQIIGDDAWAYVSAEMERVLA